MSSKKELLQKIEELELRVRKSDNLNEDLEEENSMMRNFLPPDDFHMGHDEFYEIVDNYKRKYKQKFKSLRAKYKSVKKDLKDLIKRTPSKFLSKDSDYSKPDWSYKQIQYWDKMIKESIEYKQHQQEKIKFKDVERSDEWRIEQFNRHREGEDRVSSIKELNDKVSEIFEQQPEKYIYESPDGGETIYRRKFNDYDTKEKVK